MKTKKTMLRVINRLMNYNDVPPPLPVKGNSPPPENQLPQSGGK